MNNVINEAKAIMEHVLEATSPVHSIPDVPTAEYTTSWNTEKVKQLNDIDYMWRPKLLGVVPWYFVASMCECNHNHPGALPWYSFQTSDGVWNHHPFFNLVQSKHFPDTVLLDEQGCPFLTNKDRSKPIYYCRIITHQAWGVPSILAHFPKTPTDTSSSAEKGYFALFMLLLFHPWRHLQTDLLAPAFGSDELPADPWEALYAYFEKWRARQGALETEVKQQYSHFDLAPTQAMAKPLLEENGSVPWQSEQYWAARCMPVLRTMTQSFRRRKDTTGDIPTHWLPPDDADVELTEEEASEAESVRGGVRIDDDSDGENDPFRGSADTVNNPCGDIIGSANTASEMLGCHQAIFQKNLRTLCTVACLKILGK